MGLAEHVAGEAPRCVAGFRLRHAPTGDERTVRFGLAAPSGERWGTLYGHDLRQLDPDYDGEAMFVSPLAIQWLGSGSRTLLLDTAVHGYHGELGSSVTFRGSSDAEPFRCPGCQALVFSYDVEFHYLEEALDSWREEPDWPVQDYFSLFTLHAKCRACGAACEPTALDL